MTIFEGGGRYDQDIAAYYNQFRDEAKKWLPAQDYAKFVEKINQKEREQREGDYNHVQIGGNGKPIIQDDELRDYYKQTIGAQTAARARDPNATSAPGSVGAQEAAAGGGNQGPGFAKTAYGDQGTVARSFMDMKPAQADTTAMNQAFGQGHADLAAAKDAATKQFLSDPSHQQLLLQSQGQGPAADAAKAQLRMGLDEANAQAMSMAASARGGAGAAALANRAAMQQAALTNQKGAGQNALMLANMAMEGTKGLSEQASNLLGFNQNMAGYNANLSGQQGSAAGQIAASDAAQSNWTEIQKRLGASGALGKGADAVIGVTNANTNANNSNTSAATAGETAGNNAPVNPVPGAVGSATASIAGQIGTAAGNYKPPEAPGTWVPSEPSLTTKSTTINAPGLAPPPVKTSATVAPVAGTPPLTQHTASAPVPAQPQPQGQNALMLGQQQATNNYAQMNQMQMAKKPAPAFGAAPATPKPPAADMNELKQKNKLLL